MPGMHDARQQAPKQLPAHGKLTRSAVHTRKVRQFCLLAGDEPASYDVRTTTTDKQVMQEAHLPAGATAARSPNAQHGRFAV